MAINYLQSCQERQQIKQDQGASVGKTAPGRPNNDFERIVGDPGTIQFEPINTGLLYTFLSRATTFREESKPET